jgi:hypothetical protein
VAVGAAGSAGGGGGGTGGAGAVAGAAAAAATGVEVLAAGASVDGGASVASDAATTGGAATGGSAIRGAAGAASTLAPQKTHSLASSPIDFAQCGQDRMDEPLFSERPALGATVGVSAGWGTH